MKDGSRSSAVSQQLKRAPSKPAWSKATAEMQGSQTRKERVLNRCAPRKPLEQFQMPLRRSNVPRSTDSSCRQPTDSARLCARAAQVALVARVAKLGDVSSGVAAGRFGHLCVIELSTIL
mmetsp:Transcript_52561/g.170812  ORF Transcript_52561/g.170812 Transcript_52561/m.170812 type:complete len:120 (-) Transcript_52561:3015-3374(-)